MLGLDCGCFWVCSIWLFMIGCFEYGMVGLNVFVLWIEWLDICIGCIWMILYCVWSVFG